MSSSIGKSDQRLQLTLADYQVFGASLIISLAIGLYYSCYASRKTRKGQEKDAQEEEEEEENDKEGDDEVEEQSFTKVVKRQRRPETTEDYLLGGRQMSVWPVAFSLMASFLSAITLIGVPAEVYMYSIQFALINVSYILATPIAAYLFLPVFYRLRVTSVYEYLEKRFDKNVRHIASVVFMIQMILYMGIVLYAPALALSAVTSLPKWSSIIVVGLVCTMYCAVGGIKAVLWTDVFQSGLMFVSLALLAVRGAMQVGGFWNVIEIAQQGQRISSISFSLDLTERHTFWSLTFGGVYIYLSLYGVNQTQVQRLLTLPTLRQSQKALWLSWPITSAISLLTCFTGLAMYANFVGCDPQLSGQISKSDQMIPLFLMKLFANYPGLPGLIVAGIFAGSLSTVSSFVNSLAAVTLEDVIRPFMRHHCSKQPLTENKAVIISKLLACFYGLLCLLVAYLAEQISGLLEASLSLFSVIGGPLLAIFTLGMCSRSCTSRAACWAFILSLMLGCFMTFGAHFAHIRPVPLVRSISSCAPSTNFSSLNTNLTINNPIHNLTLSSLINGTQNESFIHHHHHHHHHQQSFYLFRISYMWIAAITFDFAVIVGIVISYLFPNSRRPDEIDPLLYSPLAFYIQSYAKPQSMLPLDHVSTSIHNAD